MANQVLAYDANDGTLCGNACPGPPIDGSQAIDAHMINDHWGILSTPVIDVAGGMLYACAWSARTGPQRRATLLHALQLRDGDPGCRPPLNLEGATFHPGHGLAPVRISAPPSASRGLRSR